MAHERRVVTVVFADIVGSTEVGSHHDPEVVRATLTGTFRRLNDLLVSNGGTVEKFIGDAVMAVFGAPLIHEDDAERAARAAAAMRDAVAEMAATATVPLTLRIGVNTGEVVMERPEPGAAAVGLVTGIAVNVAARLEQAASAGEILVGALTHELTEAVASYGPPRDVHGKGVGRIRAWPLLTITSAIPGARASSRTPFVGRQRELAALAEAFDRVESSGAAQLVTIFGSAGAGKSRLVDEFLAAEHDAPVRRGRCLPYGAGSSFWPIREILQSDARIAASDALDEAAAKMRAAVFAACGSDPDDARAVAATLVAIACPEIGLGGNLAQDLGWALRRYLEGRAKSPMVLVVEDIHWAEPAVLGALDQLAQRLRAPVMILCTARPELLDTTPGWGGGRRPTIAIDLQPLAATDVETLVNALVGNRLADVRSQVRMRAEGNPLYVQEFARMLLEDPGAATMPPNIHGLIAARIDRLSPGLRRLLQTAAVVGKVFWADALVAVLDDSDNEAYLREAEDRELIVALAERGLSGGRGYRFSHVLVRDVAYASIAKSDRLRMHDRLAAWLERVAGDRAGEYVDIIAHHAEQAYVLARELHHAETARIGRRAFDDVLAAAQRANRWSDRRTVLALYQRANAIANEVGVAEPVLADLIVNQAMLRHAIDGTPEAIAGLDEILPRVRAAGATRALVELLLRIGSVYLAEVELSLERYREALDVATAIGDPELVTTAMLSVVEPIWSVVGDFDESARILEGAVAYARAHGARKGLDRGFRQLALLQSQQGRLTEAFEHMAESRRYRDEAITTLERINHANYEADFALHAGDFSAAATFGRESLRLSRELGDRRRIREAATTLGEALYYHGEFAEARAVLEEGLASTDAQSEPGWYPEVCWRLALACRALGDLAAARRHADNANATALANDLHAVDWSKATLGVVLGASGQAEADQLFRDAIAQADQRRAMQGGRVRLLYAEMLVEQRRTDEARAVLRQALETFSDPAASSWRKRAEALLSRCVPV